MTRTRIWSAGTALLFLFAAGSASAITQDFNGVPAGTVVAGTEPNGNLSPGNLFPGFTLSVANYGGGPESCVLFNSSAPTGNDWDLGTPNETFDGPGIGAGGEMGMPGENAEALGNLLVVAEDIIDGDGDNMVDDPDDEVGGGMIRFDFDEPTVVIWVKIIDIDDGESASAYLYDGVNLIGSLGTIDYGENSEQKIDLMNYGAVTSMEVRFSSSGGIGELEYRNTTGTESTSWGSIKNKFR